MRSPEDYERAARGAAARWKQQPTDELKQQIWDTFRLMKEMEGEKRSLFRGVAELKKVWQDAFQAQRCQNDFDFLTDEKSF